MQTAAHGSGEGGVTMIGAFVCNPAGPRIAWLEFSVDTGLGAVSTVAASRITTVVQLTTDGFR